MAIRYNKLWKKLIDENMMKVDLRNQAGITTNALAKLGKNEHVSTQVLEKVCKVLHCEIQGICSRRGKGRKVIWLRRKQRKRH